jgi:hypothetical protein
MGECVSFYYGLEHFELIWDSEVINGTALTENQYNSEDLLIRQILTCQPLYLHIQYIIKDFFV